MFVTLFVLCRVAVATILSSRTLFCNLLIVQRTDTLGRMCVKGTECTHTPANPEKGIGQWGAKHPEDYVNVWPSQMTFSLSSFFALCLLYIQYVSHLRLKVIMGHMAYKNTIRQILNTQSASKNHQNQVSYIHQQTILLLYVFRIMLTLSFCIVYI